MHTWTPDAPGYYEINGSAEDSAGLSGADLVVVVVEECGDSTEQSNPLPIDVRINAETSVCVGDTFVFQVIVTLDPRASLSSLDVTADGAPTLVGQQNPTTYSGSLLAASEGELEIQAKGEDDLGTTDTADHYVKVIPCDDTPNDSTPNDSKPEQKNSAPVVTVSVKPDCVEVPSGGTVFYAITIEANDADGDVMEVKLRPLDIGTQTIAGSGRVSSGATANDQLRGQTLTFTATADDGQTTSTSNTASVKIEYPGGCSPTESSKPNTMPVVTITSQPTKSVAVCKSGQTTSEKVSFTIAANDAEGDKMTVTLASYDKTISLGTASKSVGTVTGSGSLTTTETVTASQIGHTIEYTARADDGTFTGISKVSIVVIEKTTGCDSPPATSSANTAPKVGYSLSTTYDEAKSQCKVTVTATDAQGDQIYIGDGRSFLSGSKFSGPSPRTRVYLVTVKYGDGAVSIPSHFAVDSKGAATALSYTLTVKRNIPLAGSTPTYSCAKA